MGANTNPIETAVAPLKDDAMVAAERFARETVERVRKELKGVDGDMNKAAPYPSGAMGRIPYIAAVQKYSLFSKLTKSDEKKAVPYRGIHDPDFVVVDSNKVAKFVKEARRDAAEQYDAFVAKLVSKIGETTSATLRGNHVWSFSFLDVTKADGTRETWKTQTIINVSKLGKVFNQWPSRRVKQ